MSAVALCLFNEGKLNPFSFGKAVSYGLHIALVAGFAAVDGKPIRNPVIGVNFGGVKLFDVKNQFRVGAGNVGFANFGGGGGHGVPFLGVGRKSYLIYSSQMIATFFKENAGLLHTFLWISRGK